LVGQFLLILQQYRLKPDVDISTSNGAGVSKQKRDEMLCGRVVKLEEWRVTRAL
jgi:hypothetical protein